MNVAPAGRLLSEAEILGVLHEGFDGLLTNQKVLVLIPDHTRSLPLPLLFRALVNILQDTRRLDFMVALGTHPAIDEEGLLRLVGLSREERAEAFGHVGLLNHAWADATALVRLGSLQQDQIREIAGACWHDSLPSEVEVKINRAAVEYDHIVILGPTFPHEVVGFSGGAKYLFPGISGPEMINVAHWLGALSGVVGTIGVRDTPVREMIHAAAKMVPTRMALS